MRLCGWHQQVVSPALAQGLSDERSLEEALRGLYQAGFASGQPAGNHGFDHEPAESETAGSARGACRSGAATASASVFLKSAAAMACPSDSVLVQLCQGALAPSMLADVETHLDTCDTCCALILGLAANYSNRRTAAQRTARHGKPRPARSRGIQSRSMPLWGSATSSWPRSDKAEWARSFALSIGGRGRLSRSRESS